MNIADARYRRGGGGMRDYGAGMSDEVAPAGASVLPEVDDVLADAPHAQGEAGVRALGHLPPPVESHGEARHPHEAGRRSRLTAPEPIACRPCPPAAPPSVQGSVLAAYVGAVLPGLPSSDAAERRSRCPPPWRPGMTCAQTHQAPEKSGGADCRGIPAVSPRAMTSPPPQWGNAQPMAGRLMSWARENTSCSR